MEKIHHVSEEWDTCQLAIRARERKCCTGLTKWDMWRKRIRAREDILQKWDTWRPLIRWSWNADNVLQKTDAV